MAATKGPFGGSFLIRDVGPDDVVTPEDLGEEERMLIQAFKDFAEREVGPHLKDLERGDIEVGRRLFRQAAELGIFMAEVPEEFGGLDLNVLAVTGMCSIRSKLGALGSFVFAHQGIGMLPLVNFATEDQRARYLEPCMSGDILSAFALTEPSTGSDAMNITTRAELTDDGSHYVLNGAKQWITNAGHADIFITFAKVDGEHFTAFIMDRDTPGLSIGANERLLGQHGTSVAALQLQDVRIPVGNLLGEMGKGHKVAFCTLNVGRLKLATYAAGGAVGAVEAASKYAAERVQFGRPIGDFGMIQRKLSDMAARAYMAEAVAYRAAGLVYHALETKAVGGRPSLDDKLDMLSEFSAECAMAKVLASESYNHLSDEAIQVFGGYGYSEEYAPAHMYRDSRITRIYEGTNEICRLYAQRALLKRAWSGKLDFDGAAIEPRSDVLPPEDTGMAGLGARVADLKQVYLYLAQLAGERVDRDHMFDPDNQQIVASLSDVAIEIFGAESAVLRATKALAAGAEHPALLESLARIAYARAADRVRQEAGEVLAAVCEADELRRRLVDVAGWLPLPPALIEARTLVARAVLEHGGLPAGDLQPAT
ncbi:MAG: acyl-CoA dehydrogenase family protein [Gemmatimonadota bacterium]|nr:acyl-CoA dehydrogenase family protein [Gemmatimonadota bacterium]MDH3421604.1 acyl-CoA dehydrogenase family protein [Gemmatimonadota bacterium]